MILDKEYKEEIDIPVGELFQKHETVINTKDYGEKFKGDITLKLNQILKKKVDAKDKVSIEEEFGITLEYVGFVEDFQQRDVVDRDVGLVFYTRNKEDSFIRNSNKSYTVGYVSEITDIRTGQVYKAGVRSFEYDSLFKGVLGISVFPDVLDKKDIPYLKVTQMTYEKKDVLVDEKWKVHFRLRDLTTIKPVSVDITIKDDEDIYINESQVAAVIINDKLITIE